VHLVSPSLAICGLALLLAGPAQAQDAGVPPEARTKAAYDLKAELAWARGEWPDEMAGVRVARSSRRLLSWVPTGQIVEAYIHSEHYHCAPVELSLRRGYLRGRVITEQRIRKGREERSVHEIELDERLSDEHDCVEYQRKDRRGQWYEDSTSCACSGHHPAEPVLSFIDDTKAIYTGEPLVLQGECAGPKEWLPCTRGGERRCDTCKVVGLDLEVDGAYPEVALAVENNEGHQLCAEPCPEFTHPNLDRLRVLGEHLRHTGAGATSRRVGPSLWRRSPQGGSDWAHPAGVYKFKEDCLREHPRSREP
jgi:hypothetical protein